MRKTLLVATAAAALATPALAQPVRHYHPNHQPANVAAPVAGAAIGAGVGAAVSEGAFGAVAAAALPATVAGAAATGGVAGIGAAALIHAAATPCQGFHMMFGNLFTSSEGCVNGVWVGDRPVVVEQRVAPRPRRR